MKQVVYVASPESQQIHAFRLADNGELSLLQTVEVPGQVQPMLSILMVIACTSAFALNLAC